PAVRARAHARACHAAAVCGVEGMLQPSPRGGETMRSTLQNIAHIATCVTLALVGAACGRDGAPWQAGGDVVARAHNGKAVSTTTITGAELGPGGRPIGVTDSTRGVYGMSK